MTRGNLVIGYREGGRWAKNTDKLKSHTETIWLRALGLGTVSGKLKANGMERETSGPEELALTGMADNFDVILFSGRISVPRLVRTLPNNRPIFLQILGNFLRSKGVRGKARITKVVQVDLNGDGQKELILEGRSRDDLISGGMSDAKAGDYSVVLIRALRNGKSINIPLAFDHPKPGEMPYLNRLMAVGDLEGKGTMQIVISSDYYEGISAAVYRYRGGDAKLIVENGVGA